ncbi:TPA: hypothetical protein U1C40_000924 [Streptococcus suis]|nr:hypothetical protein [Streptococcus suis]
MDELALTTENALLLIVVLVPILIYSWLHLGAYQLDIEPISKPEGKHTSKLTNANYGAYIQSQGRYYN